MGSQGLGGGDLGLFRVAQGFEVCGWARPVTDESLVLHLQKLDGLTFIQSKQLLRVSSFP